MAKQWVLSLVRWSSPEGRECAFCGRGIAACDLAPGLIYLRRSWKWTRGAAFCCEACRVSFVDNLTAGNPKALHYHGERGPEPVSPAFRAMLFGVQT